MSRFPFKRLPVELIQEIVRQSTPKDQVALSMVSNSLRNIAKPVIFRTINMKGENAAIKWLGDKSLNGIKKHVRSLSCRKIEDFDNPTDSQSTNGYQGFFAQGLDGFENLTSLCLATACLNDFELITNPQPRIKNLTLEDCEATSKGLAMLVNKFPNVTHLTLLRLDDVEADGGVSPALSLSSPTPRKLSISGFPPDCSGLLDVIFSHPWGEISILNEYVAFPVLSAQEFINRGSPNLIRLDLQEQILRTRDRPTILPWER